MKLASSVTGTLSLAVVLVFLSGCAGTIFQPTSRYSEQNLIVNGDFESGNTGFSSGYAFSPGDVYPAEVYDVLADPSTAHYRGVSPGDHTSGAGQMMVVNGSRSNGKAAWSQTVRVNPKTDYSLSAWINNWHRSGNYPSAKLQFLINGSPVGVFNAPAIAGHWRQFATTWNSGSSASATVEIVALNTDFNGNDFALDDISFRR